MNVWGKKITDIAFVFPKLGTPKTWLDKCLKSLVWEDSLPSNMVNVPKHCWNLHHSTFIIFIYHCKVNWVIKSLSYWHVKSWAPKTWLDKCLKSPVWEDSLPSNMVNLPKHSCNLNCSTFIIFIDLCQVISVGKSLSYWHAKSWDC